MARTSIGSGRQRLVLVVSDLCTGGFGLADLETVARLEKKGLWADPQPVPAVGVAKTEAREMMDMLMVDRRDIVGITLVVILCIGSAPVASAASAWVLWNKAEWIVVKREQGERIPKDPPTWEILNAFKDKQECVKAAANYISGIEHRGKNDKEVQVGKDVFVGLTRLLIDHLAAGERLIFTPMCLPDRSTAASKRVKGCDEHPLNSCSTTRRQSKHLDLHGSGDDGCATTAFGHDNGVQFAGYHCSRLSTCRVAGETSIVKDQWTMPPMIYKTSPS